MSSGLEAGALAPSQPSTTGYDSYSSASASLQSSAALPAAQPPRRQYVYLDSRQRATLISPADRSLRPEALLGSTSAVNMSTARAPSAGSNSDLVIVREPVYTPSHSALLHRGEAGSATGHQQASPMHMSMLSSALLSAGLVPYDTPAATSLAASVSVFSAAAASDLVHSYTLAIPGPVSFGEEAEYTNEPSLYRMSAAWVNRNAATSARPYEIFYSTMEPKRRISRASQPQLPPEPTTRTLLTEARWTPKRKRDTIESVMSDTSGSAKPSRSVLLREHLNRYSVLRKWYDERRTAKLLRSEQRLDILRRRAIKHIGKDSANAT